MTRHFLPATALGLAVLVLRDDTFLSVAHDVNDGIVVGLSGRGTGEVVSGFLWTAATGMSLLSGLGGELTYAHAISSW